MEIIKNLQKLGLKGKQAEIFLYLYQYGAKPASTIAKAIGYERTNTYKLLKTMMKHGRILQTKKNKITYFYLTNKNILKSKIEEEKNEIFEKEKIYDETEIYLKQIKKNTSFTPKFFVFEGKNELNNLFQDIIEEIKNQDLKEIKFLGNNIFEKQIKSKKIFSEYISEFIKKIEKKKISINTFLIDGIKIMENFSQVTKNQKKFLSSLPADNGVSHIFLVGNTIYLLIFKEEFLGLKIKSEDLTNILNFLIKLANQNSKTLSETN